MLTKQQVQEFEKAVENTETKRGCIILDNSLEEVLNDFFAQKSKDEEQTQLSIRLLQLRCSLAAKLLYI